MIDTAADATIAKEITIDEKIDGILKNIEEKIMQIFLGMENTHEIFESTDVTSEILNLEPIIEKLSEIVAVYTAEYHALEDINKTLVKDSETKQLCDNISKNINVILIDITAYAEYLKSLIRIVQGMDIEGKKLTSEQTHTIAQKIKSIYSELQQKYDSFINHNRMTVVMLKRFKNMN